MRLAGYDWVPETKLRRSLRESWQAGLGGVKTSAGYFRRMRHMLTCSTTTEFMTPTAGTVEVLGVYVQLLHI